VRILHTSAKAFYSDLAAYCRGATVPKEIHDSVASIISDVRQRGDEAVGYYAAKFDRAQLRAGDFRVKTTDMAAATQCLPAEELEALRAAHEAIITFNEKSLPQNWMGTNPHGAAVGENFYPIRRVGLYIPGGEVPLVSTVLMVATLAKLAGCPEIAVFTPSNASGKVANGILAALDLVGITELYCVGGVQAIAAAAYGTFTIPAVDKLFGPGNVYVCEAKRQVFGTVGVDSLPGPSEVMVVVDVEANISFAAADLIAQAEHGSGRERVYLVAPDEGTLEAIRLELMAQIKLLTRADKITQVLTSGLVGIVATSAEDVARVANFVAPEHLELLVSESLQKSLLQMITTAGAIMLGNYTPTAVGDFAAGPSHVLPTGGAGRFFSGLRVVDFMRRSSVIKYDKAAIRNAAPVVAAFAEMERLDGHGRSVQRRTV
jgi:histidinol dehydrogenase